MTRRLLRGRPWRPAFGSVLALAGVILAGSGCTKMPLMAPSNSTITLYASRLTVGLNGSVDITATVIESAGTPVQNGTVVSFTTTLGSIDPMEARTDSGKATVRFMAGTQSGTAEIRASSGGNSVTDAVKISVGAAAAGRVDLLANPTALPAAGGVVQLTAVVSDAAGNRLGGVPVSFATDNGLLAPSSVTADANGEARSTLTTTTRAVVSASVVGGTSGVVKSDNLTIPVRLGPTVSISAPTTGIIAGVAATFSVTVTAGNAAIRSAAMDFGDGGTQSIGTAGTSTVAHVYSRSGTYLVTASATDSSGETTTATASVSVQEGTGPTVTLTVPTGSIVPGAAASFSVTVTAGTSRVSSATISFGDGSSQPVGTAGSSSVSHVYSSTGTFVVTAKATDSTGESTTATGSVTVQAGTGPTVTLTVPAGSIAPGAAASFSVTVTAGTSRVSSATIDFGDGSSQPVGTSGSSSLSHVYGASGTFVVTATATDAAGVTGKAIGSVTVQAGTVTVTLSLTGTAPSTTVAATFTATATTTPSGVAISRYEWDFGDGTTPTSGAANVATHLYAAAGTYVVTVRAVTATGATGTASIAVVVVL